MARVTKREKGRNPLIVIVGPTASGKSEFGVRLARRFEGEIISADSRQVYKGLDIGTAKVSRREMMGVPHHLLDVTSPKKNFTVVDYQNKARKVLEAVFSRSRVPFMVGGSPRYIYALTDGWIFPQVKPNAVLRKRLEKFSVEELFSRLQKLDPARAESIEPQNRRRLLRAIEIIETSGKPVPPLKKRPLPYPMLFLGIKRSKEELHTRIERRLGKMLRRGLVKEVEGLHARGIPWEKFNQFGFEYKYVAQYLQGKISKEEMKRKILKETLDFTRRQMLWFKRDPRIHWISSYSQGGGFVKNYLKKFL